MSEIIQHFTFDPSKGVPDPVAPYSHAVLFGAFAFITGQIPMDPKTGEIVRESITAQTHQVMANLKSVLTELGTQLSRALFVRVYLSSMEFYDEFNHVYSSYFGSELPARTCVAVSGMAHDVDLEIDMIVASQ